MKAILIATIVSVVFCSTSASARTWHVEPDGTGDAPTIVAGVDSAGAGDTVLVMCGTYYESGIRVRSGIMLASESGEADCVTIDGRRISSVLVCLECDSTTVVKGFTITRGAEWRGGGADILSSALRIVNCAFIGNVANFGGAVYCGGADARFLNCLFSANEAADGSAVFFDGAPFVYFGSFVDCTFERNTAGNGTIFCNSTSPRLTGCTFYGNSAIFAGGGIYCNDDASPVLENTIVSNSTAGEAVYCENNYPGGWSEIRLTCCDVYGNCGGDWVGCIADQYGTSGNFSACPSFCDAEGGDFRLCDESPCLPGHNPTGYDCCLVGAWDQGCGCGPSATQPTTWGSLKALYR